MMGCIGTLAHVPSWFDASFAAANHLLHLHGHSGPPEPVKYRVHC